jgi:hypothetical protein
MSLSDEFTTMEYETEIVYVYPKTEYNFTWERSNFFETMPEGVLNQEPRCSAARYEGFLSLRRNVAGN